MNGLNFSDVDAWAKLASDYGPHFFAVLCFIAFWIAKDKWKIGFGVGAAVFAAISVYYWASPPSPSTKTYVYKIFATHQEQAGKTGLSEDTVILRIRSNDPIWSSGFPSIVGGIGARNFSYEAVVLEDHPFENKRTFALNLHWYPFETGAAQLDELTFEYLGGDEGQYIIERVENAKTDGGAYYIAKPWSKAKSRTGFFQIPSLISSAHAESAKSKKVEHLLKNYETLSREELLKLFKERENASRQPILGPTARPGLKSDRSSLVIYYKKNIDQDRVTKALSSVEIPVRTVKSKLSRSPTNALWFGKNVSVKRARKIAEDLISAGVDLKYFGTFRNPGAKTNRIEIGSDLSIRGRNPLNIKELFAIAQKYEQSG